MKCLMVALLGLVTPFAAASETPEPAAQTGPCGYDRIEGVITSIDAQTMQLIVGETPVRITDDTIITAGPGSLTFSDLQVGQTVAAAGTRTDGVLTAVRTNVKYIGRRGASPDAAASWQAGQACGRGMGRKAGLGGGKGQRGMYGQGCRKAGGARDDQAGHARSGWRRGACGQGPACRALALPPADPGGLDEATQAAMGQALLSKYAEQLYYEALAETFGDSRRFHSLSRAAQRHINVLVNLYSRYDIEPPTPAEATLPSLPTTLDEATQLAIENAQANVKLFDELLKSVTAEDVKLVFTHLRDASARQSSRCLERAVQ